MNKELLQIVSIFTHFTYYKLTLMYMDIARACVTLTSFAVRVFPPLCAVTSVGSQIIYACTVICTW